MKCGNRLRVGVRSTKIGLLIFSSGSRCLGQRMEKENGKDSRGTKRDKLNGTNRAEFADFR